MTVVRVEDFFELIRMDSQFQGIYDVLGKEISIELFYSNVRDDILKEIIIAEYDEDVYEQIKAFIDVREELE